MPDLSVLAAVAHKAGARLVVDSTFASPVVCRPLEHGADLVLHSATKFLGGHADATCGVAVGTVEHLGPVREARIDLGGLASDEAFLLHRGLAPLDLRVERQCQSAMLLADKLSGHPRGGPGALPGPHLGSAARDATRLFRGGRFGGLITVDISSGRSAGMAFCDALRVVRVAGSLGSVHSKASHVASTTHRQLDDAAVARRLAAGPRRRLTRWPRPASI